MRPPIAAPDGSPAVLPPPRLVSERAVELNFRLTTGNLIKETLANPANAFILLVSSVVFAMNHSVKWFAGLNRFEAWLFFLCALSAALILPNLLTCHLFPHVKLEKIILLTPEFLVIRRKSSDIFVSWNELLWVAFWLRDIRGFTIRREIFIPHTALSTNQEAQEFFDILRALHQSHGTARKEEWNRKTFATAGHSITLKG